MNGAGERRISPRELLVLVALLLLAAHLRLGAVLATRVVEPVRADAADYYHYALNLRTHGVHSRTPPPAAPRPDAVRAPLYPLFLVPFVADPPTDGMLVRIGLAQAAMGVALVLLGWLLGRSVAGTGCGLAVAALTAISPHLVNAPVWMLSESLFALLLLAALVVSLDHSGRLAPNRRVFAAALLLGLAMLTRPTLDFLPVPLAMAALLGKPGPPGRRTAAVLIAGVLCVMAPWLARNAVSTGRLTDPTLAVSTLHHGIYPDFMLGGRPETLGFPYRFDAQAPDPADGVAGVLRELGRRAAAEPMRYASWYAIGKPVSLFAWNEVRIGDAFILQVSDTPYFHRREFQATHLVARLLHWPLIALAALGALLAWWRRQPPGLSTDAVRVLSLLFAYVVAVHVAGAPYPRYSVPFRPETYALAIYASLWLAAFVRARPAGTPAGRQ
jgi:hypothetical protein